jgi:hypothetical protein
MIGGGAKGVGDGVGGIGVLVTVSDARGVSTNPAGVAVGDGAMVDVSVSVGVRVEVGVSLGIVVDAGVEILAVAVHTRATDSTAAHRASAVCVPSEVGVMGDGVSAGAARTEPLNPDWTSSTKTPVAATAPRNAPTMTK